jgi:hypothetical protein
MSLHAPARARADSVSRLPAQRHPRRACTRSRPRDVECGDVDGLEEGAAEPAIGPDDTAEALRAAGRGPDVLALAVATLAVTDRDGLLVSIDYRRGGALSRRAWINGAARVVGALSWWDEPQQLACCGRYPCVEEVGFQPWRSVSRRTMSIAALPPAVRVWAAVTVSRCTEMGAWSCHGGPEPTRSRMTRPRL